MLKIGDNYSSLSINPKRLFAITTLRFPSFARKQRYARGWTINVRNLSPLKDPFGVQTSRDAKVLKACFSLSSTNCTVISGSSSPGLGITR